MLQIVLRGSEEKIELGDVKEINKKFFSDAGIDCKEIEQLIIARGIVIGESTFSGCTGLRELTIAEGVAIGCYAFQGCTGLIKLTIAEGVTIGRNAFSNCAGLTKLTIVKGGSSIGPYAFRDCAGLTKLTISEGVSIGEGAFWGCTSLPNIVIQQGVTIGKAAFRDCISLMKITIAEGVFILEIAFYAFWNCTNLKEIYAFTGVSLLNVGLMPEVRISRFGLSCGEPNNTLLAFTTDLFMSRVVGLFILCMKRGRAIDDKFPVLPLEMVGLIVKASDLCKVGLDTRSGLVSSKEILVGRDVPKWLLGWEKSGPFLNEPKVAKLQGFQGESQ